MKKILMCLDAGDRYYEFDIRVDKEIQTLVKNGFSVDLCVSSKAHNSFFSIENKSENYRIIRFSYNHNILNKFLSSIFLFNHAWYRFLKENIAIQYDWIHVHDLLLSRACISFAKKHNIPVISDFHENFPAAMVMYRKTFSAPKKLLHFIFYNYHVMRFWELLVAFQSNKIILVTQEAISRLKIFSQKITIISNFESVNFSLNSDTDDSKNILNYGFVENDSKLKFIYIGGVGHHRGISVLLDAISLLRDRDLPFIFYIIGATEAQKNQLNSLGKKLEISNYLRVICWVPFHMVPFFINNCDVGLVPHINSEHTNTTVPHKLFQYLMMKKPVLVSSCPPLKRIVMDSNCGLIFTSSDARSMAERIVEMVLLGKDELKKYGENGYRSAMDK